MTQNLNSGFSDSKTFTFAERDFRNNLSYLRAISSAYPPDASFLIWNNTTKQYVPLTMSGGATMTNAGVVSLSAGSITLGGDVTGPANANVLSTSGVSAGSYGSATQVPTLTVDAKGRLTAVLNTAITGTTPGGTAGGDLSGTFPNPTVAKVNGNTPGVSAVAHKFVTAIDSSGRGTLAQPDFSDLTGSPSAAQLNTNGEWVFLASQTASNVAFIEFTGIDYTTYSDVKVVFRGVGPVTNNVDFYTRVYTNSVLRTASYQNVTYGYGDWGSSVGASHNNAANLFWWGFSELPNPGINLESGEIICYGIGNTTSNKNFSGIFNGNSNAHVPGQFLVNMGGAYFGDQNPLTGIRFYFSAGNISNGTFVLYGRKN